MIILKVSLVLYLLVSCFNIDQTLAKLNEEEDSQFVSRLIQKLDDRENCVAPTFDEVDEMYHRLQEFDDGSDQGAHGDESLSRKILLQTLLNEWEAYKSKVADMIPAARKRSLLARIVNYQAQRHGYSICSNPSKPEKIGSNQANTERFDRPTTPASTTSEPQKPTTPQPTMAPVTNEIETENPHFASNLPDRFQSVVATSPAQPTPTLAPTQPPPTPAPTQEPATSAAPTAVDPVLAMLQQYRDQRAGRDTRTTRKPVESGPRDNNYGVNYVYSSSSSSCSDPNCVFHRQPTQPTTPKPTRPPTTPPNIIQLLIDDDDDGENYRWITGNSRPAWESQRVNSNAFQGYEFWPVESANFRWV